MPTPHVPIGVHQENAWPTPAAPHVYREHVRSVLATRCTPYPARICADVLAITCSISRARHTGRAVLAR